MLKVRFKNFWPGFIPEESLFYFCLNKSSLSKLEIVRDERKKVDIEFESVYPVFSNFKQLGDRLKLQVGKMTLDFYEERYNLRINRESNGLARRRIWYTPENLRAPHGVYDLTIGFDPTDLNLMNLYFPFWMYRLDWGLGNKLTEISPKPIELLKKRAFITKPKKACAFSSTRNLNRLRLYSIIDNIMELDLYGSAFGKRVDSKLGVASDYLFQICPENSLSLGYVTEKLIEAWFTGNIPVWQGLHHQHIFNPKAYVDVTGLNSSQISNILLGMSENEIQARFSEPILLFEPSLNSLMDSLRLVIS
jgi:Glycosyltransferase family 10 (fucosyltransferase) C-term